jgi:hypothetical protein
MSLIDVQRRLLTVDASRNGSASRAAPSSARSRTARSRRSSLAATGRPSASTSASSRSGCAAQERQLEPPLSSATAAGDPPLELPRVARRGRPGADRDESVLELGHGAAHRRRAAAAEEMMLEEEYRVLSKAASGGGFFVPTDVSDMVVSAARAASPILSLRRSRLTCRPLRCPSRLAG